MTTQIEKSLSRMSRKVETIEMRLDAIQRAAAVPTPALSHSRAEHVGDMLSATRLRNIADASGRLCALLGRTSLGPALSGNAFGELAETPITLDAEILDVHGG